MPRPGAECHARPRARHPRLRSPPATSLTVLDAFHIDYQGKLVVERIDTLTRADDDVRIPMPTTDWLGWVHDGQLRAYDCSTHRSYAFASMDRVLTVAEYPPQFPHYTDSWRSVHEPTVE